MASLTKPQLEIYTDPSRFRVVVAGRRFGKSVLCCNELVRAAQTGYNLDIYYIAPFLKMAKGIMWPMLKAAIPSSHIAKKNEQELYIELKQYKSRIHLVGADNADALRGITISFLVADEIQHIPLEVLDTILRPAMSDQKADGLYIGTPLGKGNNTAYQLFLRGKTIKNWKSWHFTTAEGGNVDSEEIEQARMVMSPKQFEQEFLACHLGETEILMSDGTTKSIKACVVGDRVRTSTGVANITRHGVTGCQPINTITLETGELLEVSSNHNFEVIDEDQEESQVLY